MFDVAVRLQTEQDQRCSCLHSVSSSSDASLPAEDPTDAGAAEPETRGVAAAARPHAAVPELQGPLAQPHTRLSAVFLCVFI